MFPFCVLILFLLTLFRCSYKWCYNSFALNDFWQRTHYIIYIELFIIDWLSPSFNDVYELFTNYIYWPFEKGYKLFICCGLGIGTYWGWVFIDCCWIGEFWALVFTWFWLKDMGLRLDWIFWLYMTWLLK